MKNIQEEILDRLQTCSVEELTFAQAREVALALPTRRWFRLIECRRLTPKIEITNEPSLITICDSMANVEAVAASPESNDSQKPPENEDWEIEAVSFEVEIEVPQFPVYPILEIERLTALFVRDEDGHVLTLTLAEREDFPPVPHLYGEVLGLGRSLCLWDESPAELRLLWTAERYFERIREWLRLSARGELHAPDQPLHPLLYPTRNYLVAPTSLFSPSQTPDGSQAFGGLVRTTGDIQTFMVRPEDVNQQNSFVAVAFSGAALVQSVIERAPRNLSELHDFAARVEIDFFAELQKQLAKWHQKGKSYHSLIVFAFSFPQTRTLGGEAERIEQHAFATRITVAQLGEKLGYWAKNSDLSGAMVLLVQSSDGKWERAASEIELISLNVALLLSRDMAAQFNAGAPESPRVVGVGAGALGSQAFLNLARAGWGDWHIVDHDLLLPHNGARHALSGHFIGSAKGIGVCQVANSLFDESFRAKPLVGNVLTPSGEIKAAIENAEIVLDFSASVPVARALSYDFDLKGRCLSLFLNPSGSQLFVLAQDAEKTLTLADLEMQLWCAIIEEPSWRNYFENFGEAAHGEVVRYARSCGDKSSRIPQDLVTLHATNASRVVRRIGASGAASISRWRFDAETEAQTRDEISVAAVRIWNCGEWTLRASEAVLCRLRQLRARRLPDETGGILLGTFDRERKIAYLISVLPAPSDSREARASFLRGCAGLREEVEAIQKLTGFQVGYLGEWHSHPPGRDSQPSARDFEHFDHLKHERTQDGLPAVLLIVGENDEAAFVEIMPEPPPDSPAILLVVLPR